MPAKRTYLITTLLLLASLACSVGSLVQGVLGEEVGGLVDNALGGGNINTSANLWIDVPRMDGLQKTDLELPLFMRLFMQVAVGQVLSSTVGGDADMVTFTTQHSPSDVQAFYSDAFEFSDWQTDSGQNCYTGDEAGFEDIGLVCFFTKEEDAGEAVLLIIANQDQENARTNVYFVRMQGSE